ncbi:nuclear transport factor 2 family protein [Streptomyces sp. NPDC046876]|uniref:nuclear transport factor 2 family protein n=1 Tax=Streptomyces sp. NPDC046876 TaxID=3155616 RepID=UPI00340DBF16
MKAAQQQASQASQASQPSQAPQAPQAEQAEQGPQAKQAGASRGRRAGLAAAAALAAGLSFAVTATAPAGSATAASAAGQAVNPGAGGTCAEVHGKIDRLEGRITPNNCAFLKRQIAFGEAPTGTPPAPRDLTHPRVQAYLDIFADDATLWEAGGAPQRGRTVIGNSITNSLRLAPELRYRGTDVVADGAVVMFGQRNEITVAGRTVSYPQIARNVLSDDGKTMQARRYYDRHELFKPIAPELRPLFDGIADAPGGGQGGQDGQGNRGGRAPERFRAEEVTARLAAWNSGDVSALTGRMAGARLAGPGLGQPLATDAAKTAYLKRFFEKADVELKAGQIAFGATTTYVEWHGTVTVTVTDGTGEEAKERKDIPFGIVERFGPGGEWELSFDTLPLIADNNTIGSLYQRLAAAGK